MSGAVTTARAIRRWPCAGCGIDLGQTQIPATPGQESVWVPVHCRECEADIRREQQAKEEIAAQVEQIKSEAERRFAADTGLEQRIRDGAAADLVEEVQDEVTRFCALRRPQLESEHADLEWNRVVAEIEAEKRAEIFQQLKEAR